MTLGHDLFMLAGVVRGVVALGTLVVVGKAAIAYRQHHSRPMLLLATGLFLLLVAPPVFETSAETLIDGSVTVSPVSEERPSLATIGAVMLIEQLIRLSGVVALLASLYVRE